jgi:hypothetical protein
MSLLLRGGVITMGARRDVLSGYDLLMNEGLIGNKVGRCTVTERPGG